MAVQRLQRRVGDKNTLIQTNRRRAAIPGLLRQLAQVLIGTVKVGEPQAAANIPGGLALFRHQTKTPRRAAVEPPVRTLVVAFVAILHVHAENVVMGVFQRDPIVTVLPDRQLHLITQRHRLLQPGFIML